MKPKTFYLLVLICTMSLFSAAKQAGIKCDKQKCCQVAEQNTTKKPVQKGAVSTRTKHSPLSLCLFSI